MAERFGGPGGGLKRAAPLPSAIAPLSAPPPWSSWTPRRRSECVRGRRPPPSSAGFRAPSPPLAVRGPRGSPPPPRAPLSPALSRAAPARQPPAAQSRWRPEAALGGAHLPEEDAAGAHPPAARHLHRLRGDRHAGGCGAGRALPAVPGVLRLLFPFSKCGCSMRTWASTAGM